MWISCIGHHGEPIVGEFHLFSAIPNLMNEGLEYIDCLVVCRKDCTKGSMLPNGSEVEKSLKTLKGQAGEK